MEDYKNIISSSVSYRRNIKDMPFVKLLTDIEQAIGVTRSLSEILGDDFEFKALKNLSIQDCKLLEEEETITTNLIDNKDISAYGINFSGNIFIYVNEQDHIRIKSQNAGYNLEKCYKEANEIDDKILDKLEMCFNTEFGFLTSNPYLCGTGMEIEVLMFVPALTMSEKINDIEKEILNKDFQVSSLINDKNKCPFITIKNKYTFGYKENEFAENLNTIVKKISELEILEENNIFDFSASHLIDKIFRNFGLLKNAYRLNFDEAVESLGYILWGINLKLLKTKKQFDILNILCKIKENHLNTNDDLNLKEIEKKRAKILAEIIDSTIVKGEVDV